jgi:hypothetical protein
MQNFFVRAKKQSPMMARLEQRNKQLAQRLNKMEEQQRIKFENKNSELRMQVRQLSEARRTLEDEKRMLQYQQQSKSPAEVADRTWSDIKKSKDNEIEILKKISNQKLIRDGADFLKESSIIEQGSRFLLKKYLIKP